MSQKRVALQPSDYVHLHNHTQYSLLDGLTKVPDLINYVVEMGMEAIAITDHGTMSGAIEFYKTAKDKGVKPIIGIEAYIAPRKHTDKDVGKDKNYFHLTMLAMNHTGYQNLMRLSTTANLDGYYYKPRIDHDLIEKYNEGIIVLSGCIGGEVADALRNGQYDQAKKTAEWYKSVFGDRYYIELQDHGHPEHPSSWAEQERVNGLLEKLAKELNLKAAITSDAHYLKMDDQEAHEVLLCVQTGAFLSDKVRMSLKDFNLNVADPKEVMKRWGETHYDMIKMTKEIADRCNIEIELGKILIPKFPVPKGETEKTMLHSLVWQGLTVRYLGKTEEESLKLSNEQARKLLPKEIVERAEFELSVVDNMGFNGYFLIVSDFIVWGKNQGIVFGPGRGSAAGSIVAYATRITELDPIKYDLLFERFLNPDRISMPDIDIDIQDSRRDEVIQYCVEKYGHDRVANIVTFGKMAARNSVRDVARVMEVPYAEADRLAKMIPPPVQGRHTPLVKLLETAEELKQEYAENKTSKKVLDLAMKVEGTIRSHGVHAAGVVIAPDDIVKFVPLEMAQKGVIATQYSMNPIEDLGLLKMDFLGLSNLTTIKNALRIIKKVYDTEIDINTIPLDDEKTFELLQRGETTGVFQLESAGMKRYLKELKPTVFDDITAMVALYRPGPMQFIEDFVDRKHGRKKIEFMHPAMENSLKNTYGVLVYQEQVMQISKEMCGFTGGQADTLRKAIGKKIPEVMAKMKGEFIEGAINKVGADRAMMEKFWSQLEEFAAYCFNKSHAACYAMIAYQTAYLKAHYPAAFMASLMTSDFDNTDRLAIEIAECKHMGIEVLAPDINESFHEFAVVPGKSQIRFGLDAIKNVGTGAAEEIIRARELAGQFESLEAYCKEVSARIVNRKSLESLIKSGGFDRYGDRSVLINNVENILFFANRIQKEANTGQVDLFGESVDSQAMMPQMTLDESGPIIGQRQLLLWERELLGLYLSQNPLSTFENILSEKTMPINSFDQTFDGKSVTVGGSINESRVINTKNGSKMAFVKIADNTGEVELILFPNVYQQTLGIMERDNVVLVRGKISAKDRDGNIGTELKVMVDDAREITEDQAKAYQPTGKKAKITGSKSAGRSAPLIASASTKSISSQNLTKSRLYVRLHQAEDQDKLMQLKKIVDKYEGVTEVVLVMGDIASKQAIKLPQGVDVKSRCIEELANIFGKDNVAVR